jgi:hypothetical protein
VAEWRNRPVYITSDTFRGSVCSNRGALSSIDVNWDVINSLMVNNKAIGFGANPAQSGTPGGGSGGAIYTDGDNYNVLIEGTVIRGNSARESGGGIFFVVDNNGRLSRYLLPQQRTPHRDQLHHQLTVRWRSFSPGTT